MTNKENGKEPPPPPPPANTETNSFHGADNLQKQGNDVAPFHCGSEPPLHKHNETARKEEETRPIVLASMSVIPAEEEEEEADHLYIDPAAPLAPNVAITRNLPNSSNHTNAEASSDDEAFIQTCRFVARIGWYACHYGATPGRVQVYLGHLMEHFGYTGSLFRVTNTELVCIFCRDRLEFDQLQRVYELQEGLHLHRLGLLNQVCKQVLLQGDEWTQAHALQVLEEITKEPDPWNFWLVSLSFVLTGTLAPAVFQGSWWDLLGGAICSLPVYALTVGLPPLYQKALPLASTFTAALVAKGLVHIGLDHLHVELVVLAAVIIQVPGYGASLAVSELITNHITAGVGRLVQALVTLGLLVGGYWLATNLWDAWEEGNDSNDDIGAALDDDDDALQIWDPPDAIPVLYQALVCAPILMLCLCIQFQISPQDVPWSFANLMLAYGTSYAATHSELSGGKKNLGVLLAAVAVTVYAQAWAKWKDRPRSIVITPALVILVSGSIGFRGLVSMTVEDDDEAGLAEFAQMFVVALLIMAGVLVGNLLLRAPTTL